MSKTVRCPPGANIWQDLSDTQYATFRDNMPYLAILLVVQPLLRRVYETIRPLPTRNGSSKASGKSFISAIEGDARLERRASFDYGFALVFLTAMHGFSALKVLLILYINFSIGTRLPRKLIPAATWIFNISILFANELCGGYKFADMASYIAPGGEEVSLLQAWGAWLDSYGGVMARWEILFNITVLRLISYNMDYYFSLDRRGGSPIEVSQSQAKVFLNPS
jgi:protein-cysteine N-palmitoyltransferase HHAT